MTITQSPAVGSPLPQAIAFVDGQNLFHQAQRAFGYDFPNYDVMLLAQEICRAQNWQLKQVRFYTGVPSPGDDPFWNTFWANKLRAMSRRGVVTYSRQLRYRTETLTFPDRTTFTHRFLEEKGIDVRISVDALRGMFNREYDVAIVFSLDQDLSEVAREIRDMAAQQSRKIIVASAYPSSPKLGKLTPIGSTFGFPIEQAMYDACIDPRDYRPAPRSR